MVPWRYPGRYKRDIAGKPFTKTRLAALRNDAKLAQLEGDDERLQPGLTFDLNEHPREDFNDRWRTTAIRHEGKQHTSLQEEAFGSDHGTSYEMKANAIRWTSDWKAPLRDKPCIDGPQIATVVGPPGEEIYCDEWGRVKVQFPWDRTDKNNDQSSCWIRVAQGWAGATWGAMAIPRVGQELIISYLDGDPDQPIATGRAYRETNLPPYRLSAGRSIEQKTTCFEVKAGQHLVLKAPGGTLILDESGITLDGLLINIKGLVESANGANASNSWWGQGSPQTGNLQEFFILRETDTGEPLPDRPYEIVRGSGHILRARTDAQGKTQIVPPPYIGGGTTAVRCQQADV